MSTQATHTTPDERRDAPLSPWTLQLRRCYPYPYLPEGRYAALVCDSRVLAEVFSTAPPAGDPLYGTLCTEGLPEGAEVVLALNTEITGAFHFRQVVLIIEHESYPLITDLSELPLVTPTFRQISKESARHG